MKKKRTYFQKDRIMISLAENRRLIGYACLWGIPFALSCVLGWRLVRNGTVFCSGGSAAHAASFLLFWLETAALSLLTSGLAAFVLRGKNRECGGEKHCVKEQGAGQDTQVPDGLREKPKGWRKVWLVDSLAIFLCWLPVFLAYYPSVFAYDAEGQLYQVIAGDYSTHHPLLHTLFLGAFFKLGGALGSYQTGMAVHSVVQMLLMAIAFGRALAWLYERKTPPSIRIVLLAFYGLFPANSILALSTTKDVLFSALALLCTLKLYCLTTDHGGGAAAEAGERAVYVCLAVLMLLFRNNAVYAFVLSVPILYAALRGKKENHGGAGRKWLLTAAAVLLLYGVCAFSLKAAAHAESGSPRELLSIPLQQMARVRVAAEEKIDPAMRQELDKYISAEWVFAAYDPHLADPVKNRAVIHDDPAGLIKTWVRLGLQFPAIYVDAFLDNSLGSWYLWDTSHAEIYGVGTQSGFGWLSTDNRTMPAGCEIVERSFLPGLRAFLERIVSDNVYQKAPIIRLLFAPALYVWLLWLYLTAALYRGRISDALPAVFLAVYWLTLLLSPTVIVRYFYPLIATIPVILPYLLTANHDMERENTQ